jgi:hypothetical protein
MGLYFKILSNMGPIFNYFNTTLFLSCSIQMYFAPRLMNFISTAAILALPTVFIVQKSQSYRNTHEKGKAIPVTDRGGPWDCEKSKLPHFKDNPLTDGGEVINLTRRPPFTPRKIPGTHFC